MMKKAYVAGLAILLCTVFAAGAFPSAKEIQARMIARLPTIKALKDKGLVGENNKGFLEFIGQQKEKEDVVTAENQDRQKVYEAIARQQETTVELVGQHRAIQIAQKAQPGEWLQDANGKWYQKRN
ncbi:MAG: YdbL family protein [Desulfobacterales bacterium]